MSKYDKCIKEFDSYGLPKIIEASLRSEDIHIKILSQIYMTITNQTRLSIRTCYKSVLYDCYSFPEWRMIYVTRIGGKCGAKLLIVTKDVIYKLSLGDGVQKVFLRFMKHLERHTAGT